MFPFYYFRILPSPLHILQGTKPNKSLSNTWHFKQAQLQCFMLRFSFLKMIEWTGQYLECSGSIAEPLHFLHLKYFYPLHLVHLKYKSFS